MKLGLQIPSFTWPGGPSELGSKLARIAGAAEDAGYESIWVMDHFFQIGHLGPPELEMLEAYTTLGYLAGSTSRVRLGTLVTGVTYRYPGILIKQVTTLDVLSGGRAWLGIGAAWNEEEHVGLGVPFPSVKERFERLEETLQIALHMWEQGDGPYEGKHYRLARALNSPQSLTRPHPPILIGGSGERKTLRLVAKYADACNLFGDPETIRRKLDVLQKHCADVGRDYDSIEKTAQHPIDLGPNRSRVGQVVEELAARASVGIQMVTGRLHDVHDLATIEAVGSEIIPQIRDL